MVNLTEKICVVCNKVYYRKRKEALTSKYCSRACQAIGKRGRTFTERTCESCGKTFSVLPSQLNHLSYCSEACRRPPRLISCATCGKRFRVTPGSTIKYCSRRCFRSFRGETSLEAQVREAIESLNIPFKQEFHISRYRVDFAFPGRGLILEVDGAYWHRDQAKDARRSKALEELGWRVVRINENEITEAANLATLLGDKFRESLLLESTQAVLPLFQTELSQD